MVGGGLARQDGIDHGRQPCGLFTLLTFLTVLELGEHLATEELEALHDVLVAVLAGLEAEDHLVDPALLVPPQVIA